MAARPFIKTAGGKTRLLPDLLARIPTTFRDYYEPFVGGGALFFALRARTWGAPGQCFLSDTNRDLIAAYREIRRDVGDLVRRLRGMRNDRAFFEKVRALDVDDIPEGTPGKESARAARFIYLNKTCFNGLHRVNKSGRFNVPFGGYANPTICDEENLRACSRALRGVSVTCMSFEKMVEHVPGMSPSEDDLVYFDPPYLPISATSNFTAYDSAGFGWSHHVRLYEVALELKKRGVHVVASNSSNPRIRDLWGGAFKVDEVYAPRSINATGTGRGAIPELIITNG